MSKVISKDEAREDMIVLMSGLELIIEEVDTGNIVSDSLNYDRKVRKQKAIIRLNKYINQPPPLPKNIEGALNWIGEIECIYSEDENDDTGYEVSINNTKHFNILRKALQSSVTTADDVCKALSENIRSSVYVKFNGETHSFVFNRYDREHIIVSYAPHTGVQFHNLTYMDKLTPYSVKIIGRFYEVESL